jgi:hypothetical protein
LIFYLLIPSDLIILHYSVEHEDNSTHASTASTRLSQSHIPTTSQSTAASVHLSEHHLRDMPIGLTSEIPGEHHDTHGHSSSVGGHSPASDRILNRKFEPVSVLPPGSESLLTGSAHTPHMQQQQSSTSTSRSQMHSSVPLTSQGQSQSASSYGRPQLSTGSSSSSHARAPVSGHSMSSGTHASHGPPEHLHQHHHGVHPDSSPQPASSYISEYYVPSTKQRQPQKQQHLHRNVAPAMVSAGATAPTTGTTRHKTATTSTALPGSHGMCRVAPVVLPFI